jgi:aspartate kinase
MNILVVKFGGSVLQNEDTIAKAVKVVSNHIEKGFKVVVVVSALKGVTDTLMTLSRKVNPNTPSKYVDEVLAMGERTSARLFANALLGVGLKPRIVDPDSDLWPIITDDNHLDANPIFSETKARVKEKLQPILELDQVPVVCGFVGKTKSGCTTTLGRSGSDTTAVLLGSCLEAKEVILVKDVDTVFSTDPDRVGNAIPLQSLDSEEAMALSCGGAKFLQPKAFQYKKNGVRIRITSLENSAATGTIIDGNLDGFHVDISSDRVTMITIVGEKVSDSRTLAELISNIRGSGGTVISLSLETRAAVLYVHGGNDLLKNLHELMITSGFGKAISSYDNLGMLAIQDRAMETSPGMIQRITEPLAQNKINIYGLVTMHSSIRIFLSRDDINRAAELLSSIFTVTNDVW